jgi:glycosyltransferase involved in cell wall biosynthesis
MKLSANEVREHRLFKDRTKPLVAVITSGSLPVPPVLGGGIQTVVYDYALYNKLQNIVIVSALDGGLEPYELDDNGIGHIRIRNKSYDNIDIAWNGHFLFRYSRYIHKACTALKELQPDIVHIHNMPHFVPIVRQKLGPKVKIILTNHNTKIAEERFVLRQLGRIMSSLDAVIYPSRRIAELDLLEKHPEYKSKVSIIYNGVDVRVYKKYPPADIDHVRKKYQITAKKTLLFVGRLVEEKGAHLLLAAFPEILKKEPDTAVVIVGSSFFGKGTLTPYVQKLRKLAEPVKDKVIFTGFIDAADLPVLYSMATLFVSPVIWDDPSPKTIYEAAACEVPILSAARGGIPEIVTHGNSAYLLSRHFTSDELSGTVIQLFSDEQLRSVLARNARQRVMDKFTCEKISEQWAGAYDNLLRSSSGGSGSSTPPRVHSNSEPLYRDEQVNHA